MDNEPLPDAELAPHSTPEVVSYALTLIHGRFFFFDGAYSGDGGGAIFPGSHLTVTGGTFYNIAKNCMPAPTEPPDFRKIPPGDINLQREIRFDNDRGFIEYRPQRQRVRRMYTAKIDGRNSDMTVAIYQGKGAEEEWRDDIKRYSWLRHPNFPQLSGFTSAPTTHATIFHDDLIPLQHFLDLCRHSSILTADIYNSCFKEAQDYFESTFQQSLVKHHCTFFIRRSTGRLCADVVLGVTTSTLYTDISRPRGVHSLNAPDKEAKVIDSPAIERYHAVCYWDPSESRNIAASTATTINLGVVVACSLGDQFEHAAEIAFLPDVEVAVGHYQWGAEGAVMPDNGWIRYFIPIYLIRECGATFASPLP
ncbi:hypothetical protein FB451DRAFT_666106 [Mycena latifolia]|nr:hypothetical protein FB451DRAFT_666106 [Mycena latifolia]